MTCSHQEIFVPLTLNYKQQGQGQDVILLHGLFGDLANLSQVAAHLAPHYRVWQLDLPNHGQSPHVNQMDYAWLARQLKHFCEQHQLTTPHVIGHSMGGKAAMAFALTYPDSIGKLVVVDIAPVRYQPRHFAIFAALKALKLDELRQRQLAIPQLLDAGIDLPTSQFLLKNLQREQAHFRWRIGLKEIEANYLDIIDWDFDEQSFTGECLFIRGGDSDYVQTHYQRQILQQFPRVKAKTIMGAGHNVHAEKTSQFNRIVLQFIQQTTA